MPKPMRQLLLISTAVLGLTVAHGQTASSNFYKGHVFFVEVFITVSQDTAIAEWYYLDGPCQAFSDTLIANKNDSKEIIGKKSQIFYNSKGCMYFKTTIPYTPPKIVHVKMNLDNNYKKRYEKIKGMYRNGSYIR
jgi:hypothetical protein